MKSAGLINTNETGFGLHSARSCWKFRKMSCSFVPRHPVPHWIYMPALQI